MYMIPLRVITPHCSHRDVKIGPSMGSPLCVLPDRVLGTQFDPDKDVLKSIFYKHQLKKWLGLTLQPLFEMHSNTMGLQGHLKGHGAGPFKIISFRIRSKKLLGPHHSYFSSV